MRKSILSMTIYMQIWKQFFINFFTVILMIKSTCKICWEYERKSLKPQNKKPFVNHYPIKYKKIRVHVHIYHKLTYSILHSMYQIDIKLWYQRYSFTHSTCKENKMNQRNFGSARISICDKGKNSVIDSASFQNNIFAAKMWYPRILNKVPTAIHCPHQTNAYHIENLKHRFSTHLLWQFDRLCGYNPEVW